MATTPSPAGSETLLPSSPSSTCAQSAKDKRYDRQLRLWGDHGQLALERSRVCVVHATATATEILKSLVLPGVGQFTIVDDEKITGEDVGNNFFLEKDDIGQNRGIVAARLLLELNPEVRGDCLDEKPEKILQQRPDFFTGFSLVIATDLDEKTSISLSRLLWESNTPLMLVRSYGLVGYIRLQIVEHTVVESHPENLIEDLRLDRPFPALQAFMDTQNLETMSKQEHMHVPYVVIIYKYLQEWRRLHQSEMPKNYKEKVVLKELVRKGIRSKEDGIGFEEEENFEEALKAINTALQTTRIKSDVQEILNDPKCLQLDDNSNNFWILARAVRDFVEAQGEDGQLPLRGSIPDMFSDSNRYIQLQNIYREKANEDAEDVHQRVGQHLEAIGRQAESISKSIVRKFCREAGHLRLIRQSCSIADEYTGKLTNSDLAHMLEQDPESEVTYYLVLRGVDRFFSEFSALPGALDDQVEPDISHLKNCVSKVLSDYQLSSTTSIKDEYIHEICRYGGAEPPALAAFMGGCAAQEAIKLITKQYVPINNLFLFNTMTMTSVSLKIGC